MAGAWSGDWSPTGHALATMRKDGIWIVSVESGTVRLLSSVSGDFGKTADWSPDASRLLLVKSNGLLSVSTLDGSITTLRAPPAPPARLHPTTQNAATDGSVTRSGLPMAGAIAYEAWGCLDDGVRHSDIEIIDAEGHHRWTVSMSHTLGDDSGTSRPVWSPDSLSLAFLDDRLHSEGDSFLATSRLLATGTRSDFSFDYRQFRAGVFSAPAWQRLPRPRN